MLIAVTGQYPDQLVDAFLELGVAKRRVDRNLLREDLSHLLSRYYGRPLGEIQLGELIEEALVVVRRHRLQLPANLTLLLKALVMCEGLGTRLDPTFNLTAVLVPYAERLMTRRYSPDVLGRRLGRAGVEAAELGTELSRSLRRLMGELERGNLEFGIRPEGLEPVLRRFERISNRLVLGIIAAFIVGLAVLMAIYHPPGWEGIGLPVLRLRLPRRRRARTVSGLEHPPIRPALRKAIGHGSHTANSEEPRPRLRLQPHPQAPEGAGDEVADLGEG